MPQRFFEGAKYENDAQSTLDYFAVYSDNMDLLRFIMELGAEQQALRAEEDDDQKCYTIDRATFIIAINLGRTAMLAEMIKVKIPPRSLFVDRNPIDASSKSVPKDCLY